MGICCHYGFGTQIDLKKAYQFYLESAEKGCGKGMELAGRFYNRGIYVERDRSQSELWLNQAIKTGEQDVVLEVKKELAVNE